MAEGSDVRGFIEGCGGAGGGVVRPAPRSREGLPPFSGDDPVCAKCGHKGASTRYMATGVCIDGGVTLGWEPNERLHRECLRCSFDWDEALADGSL